MIKQYVKLKRITPIEVNKSYDFAVKDSHRIIARKGGTKLGIYTSNCWHPDIEEFIVAKQTAGRLTKFNLSVGITDGFMEKISEPDNKITIKLNDGSVYYVKPNEEIEVDGEVILAKDFKIKQQKK